MNTTIEKIQDDILSLPDTERLRLSKWLAELEREIWDKEIENDFKESGRGRDLLNRIKSDFSAGLNTVMHHGPGRQSTRP
ncbi:MAG: hypothetical protein R6U40_06485 [Desulfobacterales bacterium]